MAFEFLAIGGNPFSESLTSERACGAERIDSDSGARRAAIGAERPLPAPLTSMMRHELGLEARCPGLDQRHLATGGNLQLRHSRERNRSWEHHAILRFEGYFRQ